jgi:endoglucanase
MRKMRARTLVYAAPAAIVVAACQGDLTAASGNLPDDSSTPVTSNNPLAPFTFYIDQASNARRTADAWRSTRPADADQMEKIASQPMAKWFGSWNSTSSVRADVAAAVSAIAGAGRVPLFVAYNIPQRDCGGLSGSNTLNADGYRAWITEFARGLGQSPAVVIVEPDALAAMSCLSETDQRTRVDLIRFALDAIRADGSATVYLDAGHARWQSVATMASRLAAAGVASANGFSLNISNFIGDAENLAYGEALSAATGGKHFIIDSGRNGLGPTADMQWCNPEGRAIGRRPTTQTGNPLVDAYLWIKAPGESDGACNGSPASGTWMPEYALGLATRG